jgi:two-component system, LytTR family, sensor kinase
MIPYINNKWYYRLITGGLAGVLTWFLAELLLTIRYRYFNPFDTPLNYLFALLLGMILFESIFRSEKLLENRYPWNKNPGKRLSLQILICFAQAFFWVFIIRLVIGYIFVPGKLVIMSDEMMILGIVIFFIIIQNLAELGFFINERYRKSLAEVEKFRKENAENQFEMLKLQLNPHFLFNSLNTLSSLVHEDTSKASEFIRRLSDVYRYVLDNRSKELVSLSEELDFIKAFTFLLSLRFQGMISFNFDIGKNTLEKKIAPMTLQLLVENAVKHNIASQKQPLAVTISAKDSDLFIENNLQPKGEQNGTGVGLKNISSRYAFLTYRKVEIIKESHIFKVIIPLL